MCPEGSTDLTCQESKRFIAKLNVPTGNTRLPTTTTAAAASPTPPHGFPAIEGSPARPHWMNNMEWGCQIGLTTLQVKPKALGSLQEAAQVSPVRFAAFPPTSQRQDDGILP